MFKEIEENTFGHRVYKLRKKHNLTQEELAVKVSYSSQIITKWEHNDCYPAVETIIDIAKLFHVSIDYLLTGEEFKK